MRKLKKTEDEKVIGGADYATRLKEHYVSATQGEHSMFAWAAGDVEKKERRSSSMADDDTAAVAGSKPLLDSSDDEDEDDPIDALLKSNTAIFSRGDDVLKSGSLKYSKLRNANAATQHSSIVSSMSFHPTENLLMTSGLDRKAKLI